MPRFACPGCKTVMNATDAQRGQVISCPQCGKQVRVPAAKPGAAPAPAAAPASPASALKPIGSKAVAPKPSAPPPLDVEVGDAPAPKLKPLVSQPLPTKPAAPAAKDADVLGGGTSPKLKPLGAGSPKPPPVQPKEANVLGDPAPKLKPLGSKPPAPKPPAVSAPAMEIDVFESPKSKSKEPESILEVELVDEAPKSKGARPQPVQVLEAELVEEAPPPKAAKPKPAPILEAELIDDAPPKAKPKPPPLPPAALTPARKAAKVEEAIEEVELVDAPTPKAKNAMPKQSLVDDVEIVDDEPPAQTKGKRARDDEEDEDVDDRPKKKKKERKKRRISTATGVFGSIGGLLLLGMIILVASGRWVDWIEALLYKFFAAQDVPEYIAYILAGVVLGIPGAFIYMYLTKSMIVEAMPEDIDFSSIKPSEFKEMDFEKLASLTEKVEALGFKRLTDYTVTADIDMGTKGFARLFVHPAEFVFAEINQAFFGEDGDPAAPMRVTMTSQMEDDWSVMTTNRSPTKESYIMRRPRAVWRSFPKEDPEGLLDELLKLRKKMLRDLEIDALTEKTADAYFEHERLANTDRKDAVRGRWAFMLLIEFWLFDMNKKFQWMGEYAKHAGSGKKK
ncbi:MAG: hypothetical protein L0215_05035 [Gemmataceae bacterium]|nr:hypothetical protein [Gemmataceae bacterium]